MAINIRICTIHIAVLLGAALATIASTHCAHAASLNTVGFVPFQQSVFANGVSADGNVVTGYFTSGAPSEAIRSVGGTVTGLGFLPPPYDGASQGTAANSDGSIITGYSGLFARPDEAFRWVGGVMTGLGFLGGGSSSNANAISANGSVIVGIATSTAFGNGEAFRWVNGTMTSLGCLTVLNNAPQFQCGATGVSADGSVVVGYSSDSGSLLDHAFRWVGGAITYLPNPCPTCLVSPAAVNSDGTVMVGEARFVQNGPVTAYRWVNGTITALGQLPSGNSSNALAVSADGSVVVGQGGGGNGEAFIWTAATGMQTLSSVLAAAGVDLTGWGLNQATGISADGTVVVGNGTFGNQGTAFIAVLPSPSPLLAAVLPESRSAQPNGTVTAFATIINTAATTAQGCSIAPLSGLPGTFVYQTTNPATNALTGTVNTPVNIAGNNASQSFVIALTPSAAFAPTNALFSFACANVPLAPIVTGLGTLLLSASATNPTPDVIALGATVKNDGIVHVTGTPSQGFFAVATDNLGSGDTITAAVNTGGATLPLTITLCQSNPMTGVCLHTPTATVATSIGANATSTFVIFVSASGIVPLDPANNRIFVTFTDSTNAVRGETSVAVETQ